MILARRFGESSPRYLIDILVELRGIEPLAS